jgi:hypothetical protein
MPGQSDGGVAVPAQSIESDAVLSSVPPPAEQSRLRFLNRPTERVQGQLHGTAAEGAK